MYKYTLPSRMSSRDRLHRRRFDSAAHEELLLLFDEPGPGAKLAAGGKGLSRQGRPGAHSAVGAEAQAVLTLGGNSAVVTVRPEPKVGPFAFDEYLPGFQAAAIEDELEYGRALEEQMSGRLEACRERRQALAELSHLVEACDRAATAEADPARRPDSGATAPAEPAQRRVRALALRFSRQVPEAADGAGAAASRCRQRRHPEESSSPGKPPFAWRKMLASAACLAGPGSIALLLARWITG
jgi:hypothetical protein